MFRTVLLFSVLFYVCSGQSSGDLRLWRNGESSPDFTYGRLQILVGGKWSEVCDTGFGKTEADVACHQLRYGDAVAEMAGSGNSNSMNDDVSNLIAIGLSDVYCPTSDYLHLLRCSFQIGQHDCAGKGYTMLECSSNRIWEPPYVGEIRLVGSNYSSQGRAQIYCGEAGWGRICSNYPFDQKEADTVCRQLGYTHAADYNHLHNIEVNYSLPLLLNNVECRKEEDCLGACAVCYQSITNNCYTYLTIECEFNTLHYSFGSNVSTCEYGEGGFIEARPRLGEVRVSSVGVAEVFHNISGNRTWSSICTSGGGGVANTNRVANTFCTQYGYNQVISYSSVSVDNGNTPSLSILCDIEHPHLLWCSVSVATTCSSVLSVSCGNNESDYYTGQLRLRDGDYPSEGRIEIYVYGGWSSISVGYYAYNYQDEADSVCRQLGYTRADFYSTGTLPGGGDVRVSSPYCYGVMQCFSQCLQDYDFIQTNRKRTVIEIYSHTYDLAVNCTFNISRSYSAGFYGNRTACSITEPNNPDDNNSGVIAAAIVIPLVLLCLIVCIITLLVCIIMSVTKRANRRARAARAGQVGYNPQVGAQVGYNPQGDQIGNTQQTTTAAGAGSGGMIMIAADQVPPQGLLLMPPGATAGQYPNGESEEKVPPPYSDEVLPSSSNL